MKPDDTFDFQPVTEADVAMLREWLTRPHVAEWWQPTPTLDEVRHEYVLEPADGGSLRPYIARVNDEPVGFIQSYVAALSGEGWWPDEKDPGVLGIDQFLADGARLNRGVGSAMVRAFVARLLADPTVTHVQTDPDPSNARAIRCYEKAGFRRVGVVDTPDGPAMLMVCDRPTQPLRADEP
jgi:RimJ/RimL family protein N-acetyltransferase